MARYEIEGGTPLRGNVVISGAKNAAVAILPAALLVAGECRIENVPDISDVRILIEILENMGYVLLDEHEHTFQKDNCFYSYASIEELEFFAGIKLSEIKQQKKER